MPHREEDAGRLHPHRQDGLYLKQPRPTQRLGKAPFYLPRCLAGCLFHCFTKMQGNAVKWTVCLAQQALHTWRDRDSERQTHGLGLGKRQTVAPCRPKLPKWARLRAGAERSGLGRSACFSNAAGRDAANGGAVIGSSGGGTAPSDMLIRSSPARNQPTSTLHCETGKTGKHGLRIATIIIACLTPPPASSTPNTRQGSGGPELMPLALPG